jgi:hypothetical protein
MSMRQRSRGNVLLVVLICLVAMSLLGAGLLRFTGFTLSNARQRETAVALSSCAYAVRQFISSAVKAGSTMSTKDYLFSIPGTNGQIQIKANHYDSLAPGGISVTLPDPKSPANPAADWGLAAGAITAVENLANALPMAIGNNAVTHTGVALCTDANSRTYEIEYSYVSPK